MKSKCMTRRKFNTLSAGLILSGLMSVQKCAKAKKRPNILIIFTDDQGYHDVSLYGGKIPTPHIDSIGKNGIRFTDFYSSSPVCTPSRFSLLTGRYPNRSKHGLDQVAMSGLDQHLAKDERLLSQMLKSVGYQTALIGKWHLGNEKPEYLPMYHGFDLFTGHSGPCIDYFGHGYGDKKDWYIRNEKQKQEGYATDLLADHACDYLDTQKNNESPFFLYLAFNAPHYGKTSITNIPDHTLNVADFEWQGIKYYNTLQAPEKYLEKYAHIQDKVRQYYTAMVANLDDNIGRVLARLDQNDQLDNTLIWFISDNGGDPPYGGNNGPLRGEKRQLFEGGIRVPSMVSWKGKIRPNQTSDQPLCTIDIVPTLATLCGFELPDTVDGINAETVLSENQQIKRKLFWNYSLNEQGAVRYGKWKYLARDQKEYLFNLDEDMGEQNNLKDSKPEVFAKLKEMYAEMLAEI